MAITSREQLKQYCLRKLGSPVIKINVADEQVEDRINDAIEMFQMYHFDASEKQYLVHTVTQQDIDNKSVTLPSGVVGVIKMLNMDVSKRNPLFDVEYQFFLSDITNNSSIDMVGWYTTKLTLNQLNQTFNSPSLTSFNRHKNALELYTDWSDIVADKTILVIECFVALDPESVVNVYNDMWLKDYTTQLIKKQWGENLSKLKGVRLPGGVEIDGQTIYQQAESELEKLESDLENKYGEPIDFFVG